MHADRLERARGRVLAGFTRRHCGGDQLCKINGARDGRLAASAHDRLRNAPRKTLLAELRDDARELALLDMSEPRRSTPSGARVHAHVQRAVLHEAEAPLW